MTGLCAVLGVPDLRLKGELALQGERRGDDLQGLRAGAGDGGAGAGEEEL
jgi:hypothetical protein